MKRWILYAVVFAAVSAMGALPFHGTDIGELAPVETVWLSEKNGQVLLNTDTGDFGRGEDARSALEDMKSAAPGTVFLETADYLVVQSGQEHLLSQMYEILRPSCMVCRAEKMPDLEVATAFLSVHEPEVTLRRWRNDRENLPVLTEESGRYVWRES